MLRFSPLALAAVPLCPAPGALPAVGDETPFIQRVDGFWEWFAHVEKRLHRNMFGAPIQELADEVSAEVDRVVGTMAWGFGPGDEEDEHAFVLSAEGDPDLRLLAQVWIDRAPAFEGWALRPAKPPARLDQVAFGFGDETIDPGDARLVARVDAAGEGFDIGLWHPRLAGEDEALREGVAVFLVQEALGEDQALAWVSSIGALAKDPGDEGWTLAHLQTDLPRLAAERGWPAAVGFDRRVPYGVPGAAPDGDGPPGPRFPRDDVREGWTYAPWLMRAYYEKRGRPQNPLRGTGAHYGTVRVPRAALEADLEDLTALLSERLPTARVLGAAASATNLWVDLLMLDREATITDLRRTLTATEFASEATLFRLVRGGPKPVELL